jgi:hypothetical protein
VKNVSTKTTTAAAAFDDDNDDDDDDDDDAARVLKHHELEGVWESGGKVPSIPNLDTTWR